MISYHPSTVDPISMFHFLSKVPMSFSPETIIFQLIIANVILMLAIVAIVIKYEKQQKILLKDNMIMWESMLRCMENSAEDPDSDTKKTDQIVNAQTTLDVKVWTRG